MSQNVTLELLKKLVEGDAVAIRGRAVLEPAGGPGDKVFPPSHSVDKNANKPGAKYAFESRRRNNGNVLCVLLDSVQSQANRMEEALQSLWVDKKLTLPVIEVDMSELKASARVKRTIRVTNHCSCTLRGDVSTSEPWVWGPIGRFTVAPGETAEFEIEVVARKVAFPGISRVQFVTREWTGTVPVKVTGYEPKVRRYVRPTESAFVPSGRRKTIRQF